jgi:hypothetical protein
MNLHEVRQRPLTLDELRNIAPSAFATGKHESRSQRYTYFPTHEVIRAMIANGFEPYSAAQSRSRIEGKSAFTKHMIRFRSMMMNHSSLIVGDVIPEVVLINAHDGTSTWQLSAGFHRVKCLNGLMVSEGMQDSIRVQHKGDVVGQVIDASLQIIHNTGRAAAAIEEWNQIELSQREQLAFAQVAHQLRFAEPDGTVTTPVTPQQLLTVRRRDDANASLWITMNRVQENVIKGGLTAQAVRRPGERQGRMVTTRRVNGIDQDSRLNRALWSLTEKMAEIKKGDAAPELAVSAA